MPISVNSGKSIATWSSVIGRPDGRQPPVLLVHQAVADLHHDGNAELGAPRVIGIVDRGVRRLAEPMRIEVRADEAVLFDGLVELFQTRDSARWVDAGQPREAVRITLHGSVHLLVRDFRRATHTQIAATHRHQEGTLDSRTVHLLDVLLER